jgi:hypothetical protein
MEMEWNRYGMNRIDRMEWNEINKIDVNGIE